MIQETSVKIVFLRGIRHCTFLLNMFKTECSDFRADMWKIGKADSCLGRADLGLVTRRRTSGRQCGVGAGTETWSILRTEAALNSGWKSGGIYDSDPREKQSLIWMKLLLKMCCPIKMSRIPHT
jgi:hypothetical protein